VSSSLVMTAPGLMSEGLECTGLSDGFSTISKPRSRNGPLVASPPENEGLRSA
jgi:hypothetical protein